MAIISIPSSVAGVTIPGAAINGPLGALFGNKFDSKFLQYPRDLGSATRGHAVQFEIMEILPAGYQEGKTTNLTDIVAGVGSNISNKVGEIKKAYNDTPGFFAGIGAAGNKTLTGFLL